jgi:hypothetical protein
MSAGGLIGLVLTMNNDEAAVSPSRRRLIQLLSLIPLSAGTMTKCAKVADEIRDPATSVSAAYEPTYFGMLGALTYWTAKAIREQYLKSPNALVHA